MCLQKCGYEAAEAAYELLNRRHFTERGVLDDMELLLEAVDAVNLWYAANPARSPGGLDREAVRVYLDSTRGMAAVLRVYDEVQRLGIYSIPTVVADGQVYGGHVEAQGITRRLRQIAADPDYSVNAKKLFNFLEECV